MDHIVPPTRVGPTSEYFIGDEFSQTQMARDVKESRPWSFAEEETREVKKRE